MAAFKITSDTNSTQTAIKKLFDFLTNFENFSTILPEDKVENFQYSKDECSFNIKGITPMKIKITELKENEFILFSSEGLAKFNFSLKVSFIGDAAETGLCVVELFGDLNPFIKTMAEKPLTALVNTMSLKLSQLKLN